MTKSVWTRLAVSALLLVSVASQPLRATDEEERSLQVRVACGEKRP